MSTSLKTQARMDAAVEAELSDLFGDALARLKQWDADCTAAHEKHMAEIAECRKALREALS